MAYAEPSCQCLDADIVQLDIDKANQEQEILALIADGLEKLFSQIKTQLAARRTRAWSEKGH